MKTQSIKSRFVNTALIIALFSCAIACDKGDDGPDTFVVNGSWSGTTSQSDNISFTIVDNSLTSFSTKVIVSNGSDYISFGGSAKCSVTNKSFFFTPNSGMDLLRVSGEFESNSSAEGTFDYGSVSGTWTASK